MVSYWKVFPILDFDNFSELSKQFQNLFETKSGYEPLNLENGSFVDSDNFDATDLRF